MKVFRYLICAIALTLGLASCSVTRYKAFAPNSTQLNLRMDNLEYLGETTISVEYRVYMGAFVSIDKVNGKDYNNDVIKLFPIYNYAGMADNLLPNLKRASFKLSEEYPSADYFIVVNQTEEKHRLFLGSQVTATARIKAYSLK